MKLLILTVFAVLTFVVCDQQYTDRYDDINIEEILSNKRLLIPYVKCLLEKGRCTPEGKELKVHIKDGMQSSCSKCTDTQRRMARKVVKHLRDHEAEYWEQLKAKYDPGDVYRPVYEAFLAADD